MRIQIDQKIKADLKPIVKKALEEFGLKNFKKTSMFVSARPGYKAKYKRAA